MYSQEQGAQPFNFEMVSPISNGFLVEEALQKELKKYDHHPSWVYLLNAYARLTEVGIVGMGAFMARHHRISVAQSSVDHFYTSESVASALNGIDALNPPKGWFTSAKRRAFFAQDFAARSLELRDPAMKQDLMRALNLARLAESLPDFEVAPASIHYLTKSLNQLQVDVHAFSDNSSSVKPYHLLRIADLIDSIWMDASPLQSNDRHKIDTEIQKLHALSVSPFHDVICELFRIDDDYRI